MLRDLFLVAFADLVLAAAAAAVLVVLLAFFAVAFFVVADFVLALPAFAVAVAALLTARGAAALLARFFGRTGETGACDGPLSNSRLCDRRISASAIDRPTQSAPSTDLPGSRSL